MRKPISLLVLVLPWCLGCYDFVDPDISDESNNAIFQLSVRENERGHSTLTGSLLLGIDNDGFRRDVRNDTVVIRDFKLAPVRVDRNETRIYERLDSAGSAGPFTVVAPVVEDVPPLPIVRWPTVRRAGPDTLRIARGASLRLPIEVDGIQAQPETPNQQWQVEFIGKSGEFFVGGRGIPPLTIEVSPNFLPPAPDSVFTAVLTWAQSDQVRVSGYRGAYNYTQQNTWTVVIR